MKVEIEGGKYTYVFEPGGGSQVLRHGQPWRDVTGDKLIYCMAAEIEELRGKLEKVKLECMGMRQGLINWRSKTWPGSDQQTVVDRDFPSIADLVKGS